MSKVSQTRELQQFLNEQGLPSAYLEQAELCFDSLLSEMYARKQSQNAPVVVGINGSQGSGKSTLAAYLQVMLQVKFGYRVVSISIDDFYLSRQERIELAQKFHPLFKTRGVPGTHDVQLAKDTITALKTQTQGSIVIPRFNKAVDDCVPKDQWVEQALPVDIVILEGWCVGAKAQAQSALSQPVNKLEASEDEGGIWRGYVNRKLLEDYPSLFDLLDLTVMLQAPSFAAVFNWRLEQEQKLIQRLDKEGNRDRSGVMTEAEISRFIQHYQRITEEMLSTLPKRVDFCYRLDTNRQIMMPA